jgi:phosphatidylglycerophosphate synthase
MTEARRPLKSRDTRWAKLLASWLAQRRVSPNAVSLLGMVFATGGGVALIAARFNPSGWNLLLIGAIAGAQLRLLCNLLDGMVAVEGGLKGKAGELYNEAPDRYADIVLLVCAGYASGEVWLGWLVATLAVLTAYIRALGASLGQGQDFCGPMAKPHRMFTFTLGCLGAIFHPPLLRYSLWLIVIGAAITAMRRVVRLYRKLP